MYTMTKRVLLSVLIVSASACAYPGGIGYSRSNYGYNTYQRAIYPQNNNAYYGLQQPQWTGYPGQNYTPSQRYDGDDGYGQQYQNTGYSRQPYNYPQRYDQDDDDRDERHEH